jgi:alanine racemase
MSNNEQIKNIDTILTYILIKKLVTPIVKTQAYKFGLVDVTGKVIKEPTNPAEEVALTSLDKIVFKLKRMLGSKLLILNKFIYLQTINNAVYDKLMVKGSILQRTEVKRIVKDLSTIQEKYGKDVDEIIYSLLIETLEDDSNDKERIEE